MKGTFAHIAAIEKYLNCFYLTVYIVANILAEGPARVASVSTILAAPMRVAISTTPESSRNQVGSGQHALTRSR